MIIQATKNQFDLFDENGIYAKVRVDIINNQYASFHSENLRWSHNIAKSMKKDWEWLKNWCREKGIIELVASNSDIGDKRWPKYIRLFGFPEPQLVSVSKQEL